MKLKREILDQIGKDIYHVDGFAGMQFHEFKMRSWFNPFRYIKGKFYFVELWTEFRKK